MTEGAGILGLVIDELGEVGEEVRSAVEWAQVRAMAADGLSRREIAARLGINRRTVTRLLDADQPPRYVRAPAGSMLDPLEVVIRGLMSEWCQRPSVSPHRRPSDLPSGGRVFSPLMAIGSPQRAVVAKP